VRALARFIDRHVTRFRPIASRHFEIRYNNITHCTLHSDQAQTDWVVPMLYNCTELIRKGVYIHYYTHWYLVTATAIQPQWL